MKSLSVTSILPSGYRRLRRLLRPYLDSGAVTLPEDITKAMSRGETLAAEAAKIAPASTVQAQIVARLIDGEDVPAEEYTEAITSEVRREATTEAAGRTLILAMADVYEMAEEILAQVDAAVVTPALDVLRDAAARTQATDDVGSLMRASRLEDAEALAAAYDPALHKKLREAEEFRSALIAGAHGLRARDWEWLADGRSLRHLDADAWLTALREGVRVLPFVREEARPSTVAIEVGLDVSDEVDGLHTFR